MWYSSSIRAFPIFSTVPTKMKGTRPWKRRKETWDFNDWQKGEWVSFYSYLPRRYVLLLPLLAAPRARCRLRSWREPLQTCPRCLECTDRSSQSLSLKNLHTIHILRNLKGKISYTIHWNKPMRSRGTWIVVSSNSSISRALRTASSD